MKAIVRVDGVWRNGDGTLGNEHHRFLARLVFFRVAATKRAFLTFRNNNSFGWDEAGGGQPRQPDLVLTGAALRADDAAAVGRAAITLGSGVEKTWEVDVPRERRARAVRETRFDGRRHPRARLRPAAPARAVSPAYVSATARVGTRGSAGRPGQAADRQADFDRFERLQRAKVDPSAVEDPPGLTGVTVWGHLAQDLASWNDYGDLRWDGNGCGTLSANHYDWVYGMFLQFMRTGHARLRRRRPASGARTRSTSTSTTPAPTVRVQLPEELGRSRRPTTTPTTASAAAARATPGARATRCSGCSPATAGARTPFDEIQEGVRQYVYESFNGEGHIDTDEIRIQGWLVENLRQPLADRSRPRRSRRRSTASRPSRRRSATCWRRSSSAKRPAGGAGHVIAEDVGDGAPAARPLQHADFLEPAIKAYEEVFRGRDDCVCRGAARA